MTKARDLASAAPAPSTVSATELGYLDGVTSNIQTQIDSKTGGIATDTPPASPTEGQVWLDTDGTTADANFVLKSTLSSTGDIFYASAANTPARIGIGSTGQVLTVSGGIPAWTAPAASGALTKIVANTFSNAATVDIVDCFSSSYLYYLVMVDVSAPTFGGSFNMQYLYSGSTVQNAGYYGSSFYYDRDNVLTTAGSKNVSSLKLLAYTGNTSSVSCLSFMITNVGNASEQPIYWGSGSSWGNSVNLFAGGDTGTSRTYTGLRFFDTSYNITGNYKVYGVQN